MYFFSQISVKTKKEKMRFFELNLRFISKQNKGKSSPLKQSNSIKQYILTLIHN